MTISYFRFCIMNWLDQIYFYIQNEIGLMPYQWGLLSCLAIYYVLMSIWNQRLVFDASVKVTCLASKGLIPASTRYLHRMSYDLKTLTLTLIDLEQRGYLRISEGGTRLSKTKKSMLNLSYIEQSVLACFFGGLITPDIIINRRAGSRIQQAEHRLSEWLESQYGSNIYRYPLRMVPAFILTCLIIMPGLWHMIIEWFNGSYHQSFMWLLLASVSLLYSFGIFLSSKVVPLTFSRCRKFCVVLMIALSYLGLNTLSPWYGMPVVSSLMIVFYTFTLICLFHRECWLVKHASYRHRQAVLGFKQYLGRHHAQYILLSKSPGYYVWPEDDYGVSFQQYQSYLAYAMALDLEHKWYQTWVRWGDNTSLNSGKLLFRQRSGHVKHHDHNVAQQSFDHGLHAAISKAIQYPAIWLGSDPDSGTAGSDGDFGDSGVCSGGGCSGGDAGGGGGDGW